MKISLNKNVIIKDYETKGLLIDVERADYRKVNSSGLTISKFLNKYGEISVEELLLKLSDLYELPEEVFGEEVQQFLDDMIEKGFFVKDGDYSRIETEETICHQTSNGIWIKVTNRCRFVPYGRAKTFENKLNMEQFYKWVDRGYDFLRNIYINYYKQNKEFIFNIDVSNDLCNQVYSKGRKTSCGVNCNQISIDSNGNVYLCPSLHIEEFELGNIRTDNITEIMEKSKQKYGEIDVEMLSKCKNCEIKYYCGGGCRAIAFNETGDLYGQERNCDNYRNRVFDLMLQ